MFIKIENNTPSQSCYFSSLISNKNWGFKEKLFFLRLSFEWYKNNFISFLSIFQDSELIYQLFQNLQVFQNKSL